MILDIKLARAFAVILFLISLIDAHIAACFKEPDFAILASISGIGLVLLLLLPAFTRMRKR